MEGEPYARPSVSAAVSSTCPKLDALPLAQRNSELSQASMKNDTDAPISILRNTKPHAFNTWQVTKLTRRAAFTVRSFHGCAENPRNDLANDLRRSRESVGQRLPIR